MKTTVDLTDGTGKASAVITKSETGEPVTVISISQQFLHEPHEESEQSEPVGEEGAAVAVAVIQQVHTTVAQAWF